MTGFHKVIIADFQLISIFLLSYIGRVFENNKWSPCFQNCLLFEEKPLINKLIPVRIEFFSRYYDKFSLIP